MRIYLGFIQKLLRKRSNTHKEVISESLLGKKVSRLEVFFFHLTKDLILIVAGVFAAGFGLKGFLLPNDFIDGGVTGISLLMALVTKLKLPVLLVLINTPFIILAFYQLDKAFGIKSLVAIVLLAFVVSTVSYPVITSDKLLVAAFGGFFIGAGIGLAVRGGAVLDGTEVLAVWLSRMIGLSIGDIILLFNIIIFTVAAYLLSVETALYSILTYLAASKTVDFIVDGVDEYMGVTIISPHYETIRLMIVKKLGRGATVYEARGGYGMIEKDLRNQPVIFTVTTRLEFARLKRNIVSIDPTAFLVVTPVRDIAGGFVKKKLLKH